MARILVIEDDAALQEAYSFVLTTANHTVDTAFNGKEGLTAVKNTPYDLILLDLHMPIMNGWEFLERYQAHKKKSKVIIFSNMVEAEMEKQASDLGAYQSILKSSMTPAAMLRLVDEVTAS